MESKAKAVLFHSMSFEVRLQSPAGNGVVYFQIALAPPRRLSAAACEIYCRSDEGSSLGVENELPLYQFLTVIYRSLLSHDLFYKGV